MININNFVGTSREKLKYITDNYYLVKKRSLEAKLFHFLCSKPVSYTGKLRDLSGAIVRFLKGKE